MTIRLITADCRDALRQLPDESVHCCVTSPPYWGLRDYGTAKWEGGDMKCDHRRAITASSADSPGVRKSTLNCGREYALKTTAIAQESVALFRTVCEKCGAVRIDSQLGMEKSLGEYVAVMVDVFREVRRVLRKDGTLWLNLGDSYAASVNGRSAADTKALGNDDRTFRDKPFSTIGNGIKSKDLCGIPWRVAFALQADGWYLRQDIIWSKPNPMPESITDRCTKAHEYIFLLSKSERYYYDQEAISEPVTASTIERLSQATLDQQEGSWRVPGKTNGPMKAKLPRGKALTSPRHDGNTWNENNGRGFFPNEQLTRNKRSVWEVTTQPFSEAHFATFPPALIEPCILAGCPKDGFVLDPFGGAGTTGLVADRLGRNAILIELNPEYAEMAKRRIYDDAPLFADVDEYNAEDDFARSIDEAYAVIRARKAAGGKGWPE
jgi:DNA modification methylase